MKYESTKRAIAKYKKEHRKNITLSFYDKDFQKLEQLADLAEEKGLSLSGIFKKAAFDLLEKEGPGTARS